MRVVILVFCLTVMSWNSWGDDLAGEKNIKDSEFLAQELTRCPLWTEVPEKDLARRKQITAIYENLARYNSGTIKSGIALYVQTAVSSSLENYKAGEKIFAFLRVIFDVPGRFDARTAALPYGVLGNPVHSDGVDLLWPFSLEPDGQLTLTGVDLVFHSGPPYDPIADFEKMASRLERRFPVSHGDELTVK